MRDRLHSRRALGRRHGEEAAVERQRAVAALGDDRMVHGHELGAVGKRSFDLHLVDHVRDAVHHVIVAEELAAEIHQLGHRSAVADELEDLRRDERDGFGIVQAQAAREPLLRQEAGLVENELVELSGSEMHVSPRRPIGIRLRSPFARPRVVAKARRHEAEVLRG